MTVDATKSPTPAWKRTVVMALLGVLILAAGYFVWTHDLHKSSPPASSSGPAPAAQTSQTSQPSVKPAATTTTVPAGLPISSRNPFTS
jgi:hypothetical protein